MQRYRRTFICILPHDGRIPKKDKKINAFIIYAHVIKSKTLNVLNFIKDIARDCLITRSVQIIIHIIQKI